MLTKHNAVFELSINDHNGSFDITPVDQKFPSLTGIHCGIHYQYGTTHVRYHFGSAGCSIKSLNSMELRGQGSFDAFRLAFPSDHNGLRVDITIGILQEYPLVLWKVDLHNEGPKPVRVGRIDLLEVNPLEHGRIHYSSERSQPELGFFSNGWQSWSPSRWYRADAQMQISKLHGLQTPMLYNPGTPRPRKPGEFSSDMFAAITDNTSRTGFLVGFLSQEQHFGSILADFNKGKLTMWANGDDARLDPGAVMETDWAVFNPILLDHRDPLDKYLEAAARQNNVNLPVEAPVGWCSWYHFYEKVTAQNVQENLESILDLQEKLPVQLVQVDDGFETRVGDWFTFKPTFPHGVAPLAEQVSREGLLPGLWLAPFAVHPKSRLFAEHPDWVLRTSTGRPANAGLGWNALFHGLDLTVPEALDYACRVVRTAAHEWGYPYLKLDFLYAAALKGVFRDPTKTRAQVLRAGMQAIRQAVGPEVMLLGCGLPLGSGLGLVDCMRIGPDVSGSWDPEFGGIKVFLKDEPAVPCARNSIHDILTRFDLHQHWWINDPDCLLVRADTKLTEDEVRSLAAVIALTGGSLLLSDDLPGLDPQRLDLASRLLPVITERARILDRFDTTMPERLRLDLVDPCGERHLLARFNWSDQPVQISLNSGDYDLEDGTYYAREFWSGKVHRREAAGKAINMTIPAHGCILLAARRVEEDQPAYLGSNLHISQGIELADWQPDDNEVLFTLRLPRTAEGRVVVLLPGELSSIEVNGAHELVGTIHELPLPNHHLYDVPVKVDGFAQVKMCWGK